MARVAPASPLSIEPLPELPSRVLLQPLQRGRHVRPAETYPEAVARVAEDRARQDEHPCLPDETFGEAVDRHLGGKARKADAAAPRPNPFEGAGSAGEERVQQREVRVDDGAVAGKHPV